MGINALPPFCKVHILFLSFAPLRKHVGDKLDETKTED